MTSRIRLSTAVALPVESDPITLAKTIATLDHLSGGRVTLGVGFGWNLDELSDHGVPAGRRRTMLREYLESMRALWRDEEAQYQGAGTCEFLVGQDGTISFLEVNTRLQVEHPVSEEVSGLDLVREQFRIARGEALGYDDPEIRGHSFEFRINGEDAGRGFLPAPGTVTHMVVPQGPGVRWDAGIVEGDTVAGAFDSMIAKLIVTGRTRQEALERSRRVLDELVVDGMATVLPFHRKIVSDPAFAPADPDEAFSVHTRWIETEFDNTIEPYAGQTAEAETALVQTGSADAAADAVLKGARGYGSNDFKIPLTRRTLRAVVAQATRA